jgi:hypothetical protein
MPLLSRSRVTSDVPARANPQTKTGREPLPGAKAFANMARSMSNDISITGREPSAIR